MQTRGRFLILIKSYIAPWNVSFCLAIAARVFLVEFSTTTSLKNTKPDWANG